ncbi:hypothetical protein SAMN05192583_3451 [Sphingomonas gellani]|uniref:Uncharacterized protein n=1 Tax=Sphingomonas gellani TaxID=1166340 RepID=A0A1H8J0N0_9SPHN|nr:hypothetical protein [Sphingomonas gellani]SEN73846.1 hypothetical protein SAMN05192583_3451 [Sphingomonas gellani]
MLTALKTSVAWQVASGFILGTVGLVALQPAEATHAMVHRITPHTHAAR